MQWKHKPVSENLKENMKGNSSLQIQCKGELIVSITDLKQLPVLIIDQKS